MGSNRKKLKADMPLVNAARILLARELRRIQRRLKLAAQSVDDVEHIHRLRISTRRAIAMLTVFKGILPNKKRKRIVSRLNKIRRVSAKARDLDVLIELRKLDDPQNELLVKRLRKNRTQAQKPVAVVYQKLNRKKKLRNECLELIESLDPQQTGRQPTYSYWATKKLIKYARKFFTQKIIDKSDAKQLHRFRIAAKKFRYTLLVLEPAFPLQAFETVGSDLKRLQNLLGEVNDCTVAIARIHKMENSGLEVNQNTVEKQFRRLEYSQREFSKWWTEEKSKNVFYRIQEIVKDNQRMQT